VVVDKTPRRRAAVKRTQSAPQAVVQAAPVESAKPATVAEVVRGMSEADQRAVLRAAAAALGVALPGDAPAVKTAAAPRVVDSAALRSAYKLSRGANRLGYWMRGRNEWVTLTWEEYQSEHADDDAAALFELERRRVGALQRAAVDAGIGWKTQECAEDLRGLPAPEGV
jgi:hypothetical protein